MEVVMVVCRDCLSIMIWSLYLGDLACLFKDPSLSGTHHQNLLTSPCYRKLMSDLSPRSPLSLTSVSNGSSDDMQDNVPTVDTDAQQTQLCWMESNLTILPNPLNSFGQPILMPLNSN